MAGPSLSKIEEDRRMREYLKGGRNSNIAKRLGISPQTFLCWKHKHGLQQPRGQVSNNITQDGEAAIKYGYPTTAAERLLVDRFVHDLVWCYDSRPDGELQENGVTLFMDEWVNQREKGGASR